MEKRDNKQVMRDFESRQSRQILAIAVALFLVLFFAVLYKRPGLFGNFSKGEIFGAQIVCIAAFMGFTSFNWRCPSCRKYLGSNIHKQICRHCKARLR
jgi:hypothetical protein